MSESLPPKDNADVVKISIITHTIIDLAAIITTATFVIMNKLDATAGIAIIALIAGVWLNNASNNKNNLPPGGASVIIGAISGIGKTLWLLGKA